MKLRNLHCPEQAEIFPLLCELICTQTREMLLRLTQPHNRSSNSHPRHGTNFHATFAANQRTVTFFVEAVHFEDMRVNIKAKYDYNRPSPYTITVAVIAPNEEPSGKPTITGTTQEGETLTADVSGITDGDNGDKDEDGTSGDILSSSFSYTWWKTIKYGPNSGTSEQIRGASGSTYRIRKADIKHSFYVKVRYRDDRGFNEELQSANTGTVVPAADARPHILGIRLVKHNTGAPSFVDLGSNFDIPQGQSFSVYVYMSKNFRHLLSWRNRPGLNLSIGGQTYSLYKYEIHKDHSGNLLEREALKFYFPRDVEVGDSGSIVFPRNGVAINNTPTIDFSYPRTTLGNMTVLGSSQQQTEEPVTPNTRGEEEDEDITPTLPPITASFLGMPLEHNGTDPFTFELRFSENVEGLSYKVFKNGAFQVTNGSVTKARRLVPGANQRWEIRVQPSNNNTITVMLQPTTDCSASGAICHNDGRQLSNGRAGLVLGPAMISIADASANENNDTSISFSVTLNRSATQTVTVDWATADGTATAGSDYTADSGTLTFAVGENTKTITVNLLSDSVDEGNETFVLNLSNASGAKIADSQGTGTISNSDPMPKAWISRFGRTVGNQAMDAISAQMGNFSSEKQLVIGGVEVSSNENLSEEDLMAQIRQERFTQDNFSWTEKEREATQEMTLEEVIHGTSFYLSGQSKETGKQSWSTWGQVSHNSFSGKEENVNLKSEVTSGIFGADIKSGNWKGGIALSQSESKGTFDLTDKNSVEDRGNVKSSLTSLFPYLGYEFGENQAVWGILGTGEGDITLTQKANEERERDERIKTDISMRMGAVGAKGPLLKQSEGETADVTLQVDGMYLKMKSEKTTGMESSEADVTQLRLFVDSSKTIELEKGTLTPSFQVG